MIVHHELDSPSRAMVPRGTAVVPPGSRQFHREISPTVHRPVALSNSAAPFHVQHPPEPRRSTARETRTPPAAMRAAPPPRPGRLEAMARRGGGRRARLRSTPRDHGCQSTRPGPPLAGASSSTASSGVALRLHRTVQERGRSTDRRPRSRHAVSRGARPEENPILSSLPSLPLRASWGTPSGGLRVPGVGDDGTRSRTSPLENGSGTACATVCDRSRAPSGRSRCRRWDRCCPGRPRQGRGIGASSTEAPSRLGERN